jgi:hypothetical protein
MYAILIVDENLDSFKGEFIGLPQDGIYVLNISGILKSVGCRFCKRILDVAKKKLYFFYPIIQYITVLT